MRLFDYIQNGGTIMYILLFLNIIGLSIVLWKFLTLIGYRKKIQNSWTGALVSNFKSRMEGKDISSPITLELLKEEVSLFVRGLEFGLNTVKIIASIAPLLGLLGTVIGILSSFDVISKQGLDDPSLFAGGISLALITTVGGLIVAIPHFIGYNYLVGMIDNIESELEKSVIKEIF